MMAARLCQIRERLSWFFRPLRRVARAIRGKTTVNGYESGVVVWLTSTLLLFLERCFR